MLPSFDVIADATVPRGVPLPSGGARCAGVPVAIAVKVVVVVAMTRTGPCSTGRRQYRLSSRNPTHSTFAAVGHRPASEVLGELVEQQGLAAIVERLEALLRS